MPLANCLLCSGASTQRIYDEDDGDNEDEEDDEEE